MEEGFPLGKNDPGYLEAILPHVSIDCVVFGYQDGRLRVLLLKWKGSELWSVAGGSIFRDEAVEDAANRILSRRTGLSGVFFRQFYTFGAVDRVKIADYASTFATQGFTEEAAQKLLARTVSVGYYALVNEAEVSPEIDGRTDTYLWCDINHLPTLVFDHQYIVEKALEALRHSFRYEYLGQNLLPDEFTMPELQRVYETILNQPIDRANFQKRMLSSGCFERTGKRRSGGAHKSPFLYRFNNQSITD